LFKVKKGDTLSKLSEGEDFTHPREIWLRISQGKQKYMDIFRGLKYEPDAEVER
jgi:hypothetical protein